MNDQTFSAGFMFAGLGAGARGFLEAVGQLGREGRARFTNLGGIDNDPLACQDFEYLTGGKATVADIATMTAQELRAAWGDKVPDTVFMSPPCLPGNGLVLTSDGPRAIETLRPTDLVLTHRGHYRQILKTGRQEYGGVIYGLRLNGTVDTQEFTAEHPIWIRRVVRTGEDKRRHLSEPSFVQASEVRAGDRVGFPVQRERFGTAKDWISSFNDPTVFDGRRVGRVHDLRPHAENAALWYLFGVYLGDGYRRQSRNEVILCVGAGNSPLALAVRHAAAELGLPEPRQSDEGGPTNVKLHISAKHLSRLCGAFGDGAENKAIPEALMGLEGRLVDALIEGYRATDGSESAERPSLTGSRFQARWRIASVSLQLLRDIQRLLVRRGVFGKIHVAWPGGPQVIEGRQVNTLPRWEIAIHLDPKKRTAHEFIDGAVWIRVRDIVERRAIGELVWNLEVEEDNTFCAPMIGTHNCKGFSGLLPKKAAEAPKYQALNRLVLQGMFLACETWSRPPSLLVLENVPRITSRGALLLAQVRQLLARYGYLFHEDFHDCGEIGALAQHRRRYLMVARHPKAVPAYVYLPPKHKVKACGSVLGELPLPETTHAGELHRLPRLSWINWVRLALIPAGGDWRDLPTANAPGKTAENADSFSGRPGFMGVADWKEPTRAVTGKTNVSSSSGPGAVADPRLGFNGQPFKHVCRVTPWNEPAGTITASPSPSSGAAAVADPRVNGRDGKRFTDQYRVSDWERPARTVTGSTDIQEGAQSIADPRINPDDYAFGCKMRNGTYGVLGWEEAAATVTGSAQVDNGTFAVADPRKPPGFVPVIIAKDGTWHRPLTTLELAALQGLPDKVDGKPLTLAGRSVAKWRERIGNAVPVGAARAIASSLLTALLAAKLGTWVLGGTGIWVRAPKAAKKTSKRTTYRRQEEVRA